MIGPRYVLSSYEKKLHDMDYQKHMKRLGEIQGSLKKSQSDNKHLLFRNTLSDLHSKRMEFQKSEKILVIDKTNQVLLDKLVKISRNEKPPLYKPAGWSGHPGTLNTTYRKQELGRIALENEAFAKRLISQHGSLSHKRLDSDFNKHLDLLKQVQKVPSPTPKFDKLPPLGSPQTGKSKKGLKLKKKKRSKKRALAEARTAVTEGGEFDTPMTQEAHNNGAFNTESAYQTYQTEHTPMTEESPKKEEHHIQQETQEDENNKPASDNASQEEKVPSKEKLGEEKVLSKSQIGDEMKASIFHRKDDKAKTEIVSPRAGSKEATPKNVEGHRGFKRSGTIQHPKRNVNEGRKLSQYSSTFKPKQAKSEVNIQDAAPANGGEAEKEKENSVEKEKDEGEMNKEEMKNTLSQQQIDQLNNEENTNEKSASGSKIVNEKSVAGSKVVNEKSVSGSKVVESQSKGNL